MNYANDIQELENRLSNLINTEQNIPSTIMKINKNIFYIFIPIIVIFLLIIFKPGFIYSKKKIDDILFEKKIDIKKLAITTTIISFFICIIIFSFKYKNNILKLFKGVNYT